MAGVDDRDAKPPWIYEGGPKISAPQPASARQSEPIKDLNDLLRTKGPEAIRQKLERAQRALNHRKALANAEVEDLLEHLNSGGSISDGDYLEKFRYAHKVDARASSAVWAALERDGKSRDEIIALLNGDKRADQPPAIISPPVFPNVDKHGNPKPTFANARVAIAALGVTCRYNIFRERLLVGGRAIEQWAGDLSDQAVIMLRGLIDDTFKFDPGQAHTLHAAIKLCLENTFNPICEYLDAVKWDGIARVESWMVDYLGAEDTPLNRAIGRMSLIAAVRRARIPGCKFDQILVLEGPEGGGKSSAVQILAGNSDYFSDSRILDLEEREQQEAAAGIWIYEIADLPGMSKADIDKVKAFASRTEDRARPAYGRVRVNQKRRCIFIGTTNADSYLKSQTGNRRFWPVKAGRIDLEKLKADRDQLWAEAAFLEATGCSLVLPKDLWAQAAIEQEQRLDHDPWFDILASVKGVVDTASGEERIAARAVLDFIPVARERQNDTASKKAAACMRKLGWSGPTMMRIEGMAVRGYRKSIVRPNGVAPPGPGIAPEAAEGGITAPGEDATEWPDVLNEG